LRTSLRTAGAARTTRTAAGLMRTARTMRAASRTARATRAMRTALRTTGASVRTTRAMRTAFRTTRTARAVRTAFRTTRTARAVRTAFRTTRAMRTAFRTTRTARALGATLAPVSPGQVIDGRLAFASCISAVGFLRVGTFAGSVQRQCHPSFTSQLKLIQTMRQPRHPAKTSAETPKKRHSACLHWRIFRRLGQSYRHDPPRTHRIKLQI